MKHNATGRTARRRSKPPDNGKPTSPDLTVVRRVPDGEPFVQLWLGLLSSDAWRKQSINCRRFIDFLTCEHQLHAGFQNGYLLAPYDQLEAWGIGRRFIAAAIREAEQRGLVVAHRQRRLPHQKHLPPTLYRLTFLPSREVNEWSQVTYAQPTFLPKGLAPATEKQIAGSAPLEPQGSAPLGALGSAPKYTVNRR